jgi:hypothetical protein
MQTWFSEKQFLRLFLPSVLPYSFPNALAPLLFHIALTMDLAAAFCAFVEGFFNIPNSYFTARFTALPFAFYVVFVVIKVTNAKQSS